MPSKNKILLITSNHISSNPRLVKEAECLVRNKYSVAVLSFQSLNSLDESDNRIAEGNKFKLITVKWFTSKIMVYKPVYKLLKMVSDKVGNSTFSNLFFSPSILLLFFRGLFVKCDFIIAHNLPALAAAGYLSKLKNIPFAFDAEDFHRGESNTISKKEKNKLIGIENCFLPDARYITCASPLIQTEYKLLFPNGKFETVNNVFSSTFIQSPKSNSDSPLQLFWFSQTVGPQRGIEDVIKALGFLGDKCDAVLNLLGKVEPEYKDCLIELSIENQFDPNRIIWIDTVEPDSIFIIASKMDVGLALETKTIFNRNICLTNKIFTYMNSGLAVIASDTDAQKRIINEYPGFGKLYTENNHEELADTIHYWDINRGELNVSKKKSSELARTVFNWEMEQDKFLEILKSGMI